MTEGAADRAVARAIDALRRGWPVEVTAGLERVHLLAVEGADEPSLLRFDPDALAPILISAARAQTSPTNARQPTPRRRFWFNGNAGSICPVRSRSPIRCATSRPQ